MELILIKPIRKLGKIGELVKVKDGFGRNFLLPRALAVRATQSNKEMLETSKKDFEERNVEAIREAKELSTHVEGKNLVFIKQSSNDGRLFGSVSNKEISKELENLVSQSIPYTNIIIETPIKTLGIFTVDVLLHAEIIVKINIIVARSQTEAADTLRKLTMPEDSDSENDNNDIFFSGDESSKSNDSLVSKDNEAV